jgi:Holliday junction resolvase
MMMTTRKSHKARGAQYETDLKDYFRGLGFDAERLARRGSKDEGDVVVRSDFFGSIGILEAKAPGAGNKIDLSGWQAESKVEARNYAEARDIEISGVLPAVVIKARGKSIADSYLVLRLGDVFG